MPYTIDQHRLDYYRLGGWLGYQYTKSLLHFDGSDASTIFTDDAPISHAWTAAGNAQLSTVRQKFGTASLLLDGSGDYVSTDDSDDWNFSTGDFTVEMWVYLNAIPSDFCIWAGQHVDAGNRWAFYQQGSSYLSFVASTGGSTIAFYYAPASATVSVGAWTHIAVVRSGTSILIFKNGVKASPTAGTPIGSTPIADLAAPLILGARIYPGNADRFVNGYIDEFRLSKGIARWTDSFTPPIVPYS